MADPDDDAKTTVRARGDDDDDVVNTHLPLPIKQTLQNL